MLFGDPVFRLQKAAWLNRQPVLAATDVPADEAGGFQDSDVSRDAGERHRKGRCNVGDAGVTGAEGDQERPPGRVRQGREGAVDMLNHFVEHSRAPA